ncbi:hypothetical protein AVEN_264551-1 [Araneus ventricosus]|uniref:Uncharacterized protein n=1 Tax=Araneus ventricosus TaxID=182803 RepID=A0A4Y2KWY5_ARAVE|nr:hypothetical protein AVEN_264551-1 [Araneus ventricosus]
MEIPTDVFGNKLRVQVEDRLKFYETGDIPKKNIDVMDEALEEAEVSQTEILKKIKKEKKKAKKRKLDELYLSTELDESMGALAQATEANDGDTEVVKKKKKKKKHNDAELEMANNVSANESQEVYETSVEPPKKKRKNKHIVEENNIQENGDVQENDSMSVKKKKKKRKNMDLSMSQEE